MLCQQILSNKWESFALHQHLLKLAAAQTVHNYDQFSKPGSKMYNTHDKSNNKKL